MLNELGLKYQTDKSSSWHNYLKYYEWFLSPIKYKEIKLLEIGVWEGASIKMWKEYFPNGIITGMDIEDKSQYAEDRINIYRGDQYNIHDLIDVSQKYGPFDVIIDDGSHHGQHQKLSFNILFPMLNSGGIYIIEDCLCSYSPIYNYDFKIIDLCKSLIDDVNMNGKLGDVLCANKEKMRHEIKDTHMGESIEFVFNSCGTSIIKKF